MPQATPPSGPQPGIGSPLPAAGSPFPNTGLPGAASPRRRRRSMPAVAYVAALAALAGVLLVATFLAARQAPHPDGWRSIAAWDVGRLDWWSTPLERNAFRRDVVRGDLAALATVPDSNRVWAVGQGGLILHSSDGGHHWQQQRPAPLAPARRVAESGDDAGGWSLWPQARAAAQVSKEAAQKAPAPPVVQTAAPQDQRPQQQQQQQQQQQAPNQPATVASGPVSEAASGLSRTTPAASTPAASASASPSSAASNPSRAAAPTDTAGLNGVSFIDARRGVAVGDGGTVLRTEDGGASWQRVAGPTRANLNAVRFAPGSETGWIVGDGWTVWRSADAGKTWAAVYQTSPVADLIGVDGLADGASAWIVGKGGHVASTTDGGKTWRPESFLRRAPLTTALTAVRFSAEAKRGWLVGEDGQLWTRAEGERDWTGVNTPGRSNLLDLDFDARARLGVAVSQDGSGLISRDGGATWAPLALPTSSALLSVRLQTAGERATIVASGEAGTVLVSDDLGATWTRPTAGARASLRRVALAADGRNAWAVGPDAALLHSADGGADWRVVGLPTPAPAPTGREPAPPSGVKGADARPSNPPDRPKAAPPALRGLQLSADGQRIRLAGGADALFTSTDGGRRWAATSTNLEGTPWSGIWFADDGQRGWLAGGYGQIAATTDGGATWRSVGGDGVGRMNDLAFAADAGRGWAVGDVQSVFSTTDAGRTWRKDAAAADVKAVAASADGRTAIAVGGFMAPSGDLRPDQGALLTADGDGRWRTLPFGAAPLHAVALDAAGRRGWIAGAGGALYVTADGGARWTPVPSGSTDTLRGIALTGAQPAMLAVGDGASVISSLDGGATWAPTAAYRRYWAPWYFVILATSALGLTGLIAFVEPRRAGTSEADGAADAASQGADGAATTLASDQPVQDKSADLLGYRVAVEALSSFVRNRATEPRVTIAVSGEWGSGKSSIMRMLQHELGRAGFRTAWFNAWHHQQEGRPLAALFNVVRQQAVPQWWSLRLVDALRVRSRLIWGRGGFYKAVAVACAVGVCLLLGDLFGAAAGEDVPGPAERIAANFRWSVLQQKPSAISRASLAQLDPFDPIAAVPKKPRKDGAAVDAVCADPARVAAQDGAEPVSGAVWCALARQLLWGDGADRARCRVESARPEQPSAGAPGRVAAGAAPDAGAAEAPQAPNCLFRNGADLIETIESTQGLGLKLAPGEKKAILAAAETVPPPPVFRWFESSLLGGAAGFLLLLFTKGVSVYGLQLTAPLRALAGTKPAAGDGKEAAGTVERYRGEFRLLCDALDGRLVVFIDDLDRCTPETVGGMLELTNYLVDVGRCFVVIGAAMDRVKKCVRSPVASDDPDAYATEYLRKLVHIELPVPARPESLGRLVEPRRELLTRSARDVLARRALWIGVAALVLGGLWQAFEWGGALHRSGSGRAVVVLPPLPAVPAASASSAGSIAAASPADAASAGGTREAARLRATGGEVGVAPTPAARQPLWPWAAAAAAIAAALVWQRSQRTRQALRVALGGALRESDSERFMAALRLWNDLVVQHDPTPRQIKRFYNRARLFAAYERQDRSGAADAIDDAALVGLAATHHVSPRALAALSDATLGEWLVGPRPEHDGITQLPTLHKAWQAHFERFGSLPTPAEMRRFGARVAGIGVR